MLCFLNAAGENSPLEGQQECQAGEQHRAGRPRLETAGDRKQLGAVQLDISCQACVNAETADHMKAEQLNRQAYRGVCTEAYR